jgi:hypothetical protein
MKLLTKTEIMAIEDIGAEVVEVPEWGGFIRLLLLQPTPGTAKLLEELNGEDDSYARILSKSIVDERGDPILTESELKRCNSAVVKRLARRLLKCLGGHNECDPASDVEQALRFVNLLRGKDASANGNADLIR